MAGRPAGRRRFLIGGDRLSHLPPPQGLREPRTEWGTNFRNATPLSQKLTAELTEPAFTIVVSSYSWWQRCEHCALHFKVAAPKSGAPNSCRLGQTHLTSVFLYNSRDKIPPLHTVPSLLALAAVAVWG